MVGKNPKKPKLIPIYGLRKRMYHKMDREAELMGENRRLRESIRELDRFNQKLALQISNMTDTMLKMKDKIKTMTEVTKNNTKIMEDLTCPKKS